VLQLQNVRVDDLGPAVDEGVPARLHVRRVNAFVNDLSASETLDLSREPFEARWQVVVTVAAVCEARTRSSALNQPRLWVPLAIGLARHKYFAAATRGTVDCDGEYGVARKHDGRR
jgi:hypothetical protein